MSPPEVAQSAANLVVPAQALLPLESVTKQLRECIPEYEWLLGQIESQEGWLRFPPQITRLITNLKIESYPLLYTNENAIAAILLLGFLTQEQIVELGKELESASLEERAEFLDDFDGIVSGFAESFSFPKTAAEEQALREQFFALSPEEQKQSVKVSQHFFACFLPAFHQVLSIMVHGEKLTSLVAQAHAGDDEAFVKAVQIDRRILTEVPYFKARFARSQDDPNSDFSDKIAYRLRSAPYRGKIRHKTLWLTFSFLDQAGWLDKLSYREILRICDDAGVDGFKSRIQSEKHLGHRLRDYREFQRRGIVTTS